MIDRSDYLTSKHSKVKAEFDPAIQSRIYQSPQARIRIKNIYSDADRELKAYVETKFLANLTGTFRLQVVLTEDSIIDWQVWYGHNPVNEPNFSHHHIMRTSLNSDYGIPIIANTVVADSIVVSGYSFKLDPSWNEKQCTVVAFVYNDQTKEVIQAEEVKVK
jgi:hypothetical protein